MELIRSDLEMVLKVFEKLELIAAIDNIHSVEIKIENECGDKIVIGYGENGDPCVLDVHSASEPFTFLPPNPSPFQPAYPNTPGISPLYPSNTWLSQPSTGDAPPQPPYINCSKTD